MVEFFFLYSTKLKFKMPLVFSLLCLRCEHLQAKLLSSLWAEVDADEIYQGGGN